jgi:hypothetical protein
VCEVRSGSVKWLAAGTGGRFLGRFFDRNPWQFQGDGYGLGIHGIAP